MLRFKKYFILLFLINCIVSLNAQSLICDLLKSKTDEIGNANFVGKYDLDSLVKINFLQDGKKTLVIVKNQDFFIEINSVSPIPIDYYILNENKIIEFGKIVKGDTKTLRILNDKINKSDTLSYEVLLKCTDSLYLSKSLNVMLNDKESSNKVYYDLKSAELDDRFDKKNSAVITQYKSNGLVSPGEKALYKQRFLVSGNISPASLPKINIYSQYDALNFSNVKINLNANNEIEIESLLKTSLIPVKDVIFFTIIDVDTFKCIFNFDKPLNNINSGFENRPRVNTSQIIRFYVECNNVQNIYYKNSQLYIDMNISHDSRKIYELNERNVLLRDVIFGDTFSLPCSIVFDENNFIDFMINTDSVTLIKLKHSHLIVSSVKYQLKSKSKFQNISNLSIGSAYLNNFIYAGIKDFPIDVSYSNGNLLGFILGFSGNLNVLNDFNVDNLAYVNLDNSLIVMSQAENGYYIPNAQSPILITNSCYVGIWKRINGTINIGIIGQLLNVNELYQYKKVGQSSSEIVFLNGRSINNLISPGVFVSTSGKIGLTVKYCYNQKNSNINLSINIKL